MKKLTTLFSISAAFFCISSNAQTTSCPSNVDFESGNYNNWTYYYGTCCTGTGAGTMNIPNLTTTPPAAPYIPCEFALTGTATGGSVAITGIDPFGGFPVVGAGNYSLRIGSSRTETWAEKAEYSVQVPAGSTDYSLIYRYAVVLENPSHPPSEQPRFDMTVTDSATGAILPCANYNYVSGALPTFIGPVKNVHTAIPAYGCTDQVAVAINSWATDVYYMPWTTASINLSGYGGHTIIMSFAAGDCALGGHMGYGYIDMTCGLFAVNLTTAGAGCSATSIELIAPPGFSTYEWFDSLTFTTLYGVTDTITIPAPATTTTYAVILTPYSGFGCPDTLYTTFYPSTPVISGVNTVCVGSTSSLSASIAGGTWSSGAAGTATVSASGVVSGVSAGIAEITYLLPGGCSSTDTVTVNACTTTVPAITGSHTFDIYPNPANTLLNISSTDNITNVVMTNLTGQTVYTYECNSQQVQVSVADLPPGVYFVKVNGADVRKFVKQ